MTPFMYRMIHVVVAASALSAAAVTAPPGHPVTAEQISTAISDTGMLVSPAQVKLLTQVHTIADAPRLKVESIQKSGNKAVIVRMGCEVSAQCLPFFVRAELDQNGDSKIALHSNAGLLPNVPRAPSKQPLVRAGAQAVLLLESERVHIRIPVVCIEDGALGQNVRVRGSGNRQMYVAEVVDTGSLKGRL